MKKYIKKFTLFAITSLMLASCSGDFLDVDPTSSTEETYYRNEAEVFAGLVSVYDLMRKNSGGFENMITMFNAGSDDHFAGGGNSSDGAGIQSFSNYTINTNTIPDSFWSDYYRGIFRANLLLQKIPNITFDNESNKARFTAEAKVLRAYYYFNLVRMFKNIPLILEPLTASQFYSVTQAPPADVYAQIELDLTEAIPNLPATVNVATDGGRLTQGSAKAILGKVYLYEGKNSLAAAQFLDVNGTPGSTSQYGYRLLSNFNDLWNFSNKFNTESVLEVAHSAQGSYWGNWGGNSDEGNTVNQMVGPRSYLKIGAAAPDIPSGWSFNVFTEDFHTFIQGDPRAAATMLDVKALKTAGQADYIGAYQDTGYFLNKFLPRMTDVYSGPGDAVLNYRQNTYAIRLADTYLMEAEALGGTGARAQALLDAVRARVGLASVAVSIPAIKDERRRELAGEGHRWFDLVRWGDAPAKLASRGFVAGKNEVLPIPFRELDGTQLQQNPGYPN